MLGSGVPSFTRSQLSLLTRSSACQENDQSYVLVRLVAFCTAPEGSTPCCDKAACLFQLQLP